MIGPRQRRQHVERDSRIARDDPAERAARHERVGTDPCGDAGPAARAGGAVGGEVAAAEASAQHLVVSGLGAGARERGDDRALQTPRQVGAGAERRHAQEFETTAMRRARPCRILAFERAVLVGHRSDYRPAPRFAKQAIRFRPPASRYPGGRNPPASRCARRLRRHGSGPRRRPHPAPLRRARDRLRRRCRLRCAPSPRGTL